MRTNFISAVCAASLLWFGTAHADLITNGGFDTGDLTGWSTNSAGDVMVTNLSTDAIFSGAVTGMDGYYAVLGKASEGDVSRLYQDFDISGYSSVEVSFDWVFDFTDAASGVNDVFVSILRDFDSETVNITLDRINSTGNANNSNQQLLFGSYYEIIDISGFTPGLARLRFQLTENLGDVYSKAGIDNVSVKPVPEPASMLLLGTGLAGLIAVGRRKAKKRENSAQ